jgi:hypothetical protein
VAAAAVATVAATAKAAAAGAVGGTGAGALRSEGFNTKEAIYPAIIKTSIANNTVNMIKIAMFLFLLFIEVWPVNISVSISPDLFGSPA